MSFSFIIRKYLNVIINLFIFSTKSFLNKLSDVFNSYMYKGLIELLLTQLFLMRTIYIYQDKFYFNCKKFTFYLKIFK